MLMSSMCLNDCTVIIADTFFFFAPSSWRPLQAVHNTRIYYIIFSCSVCVVQLCHFSCLEDFFFSCCYFANKRISAQICRYYFFFPLCLASNPFTNTLHNYTYLIWYPFLEIDVMLQFGSFFVFCCNPPLIINLENFYKNTSTSPAPPAFCFSYSLLLCLSFVCVFL